MSKRTKPSPIKSPTLAAKIFGWASLFVLIATSILWAYRGASVHSTNADQLVNSYLFDSNHVFKQATLPGQHSFLIKWPLIFLVKLLGSTPTAFTVVTILCVLITIVAFAYILYRIERRPLYVGLLYLCLASTLLLVPAAPFASALLPVNMAMITTRNVEYIVYIASLILLIRSRRLRSTGFWIATIALATLIASDKLFLGMAVGGALIGLLAYALTRGWNMVSFSAGWLVDGLVAGVLATVVLALVPAFTITHIASSGTASPYTLTHGPFGLALGFAFGVLGLLTNFGANPIYDSLSVQSIPRNLMDHLFSFSGPGFILNACIVILCAVAIVRIIQHSFAYNRDKTVSIDDRPTRLSILLILSSLAAGASFVLTDHYWPADSRYLAIGLFTAFICLATYGRSVTLRPKTVYTGGAVLLVVICLSTVGMHNTATYQKRALEPINKRNQVVTELMHARNAKLLVGDYWRVIPIRQASHRTLQVTPLANCTTPRDVLSSAAWQSDLTKHGFAYLLSLDRSLTDYPHCSLEQVTAVFGRPNKSSVVAGTASTPTELLLFYDSGIHKSSPTTSKKTSTIFPVASADLPDQVCDGPTVVQTIAHQDDDLLFMNPDLANDIRDNKCIRSIYLTAGDAGGNSFYWLGREKGAEYAYSKMLGIPQVWVERTIKLQTGQFITITNPRGNPTIQLIFMHLPDGNINGKGFVDNDFASLEKLNNGVIKNMVTVDDQSSYSRQQLVDSLAELFEIYRPTLIRTQSSLNPDPRRRDHSDHIAVGRLTQSAYEVFESKVYQNSVTIPIEFYAGYGIADQPANVTGPELEDKNQAFSEYTKHDPAACSSNQSCWMHSSYREYLPRQYRAER